jgi:uncharacterized membrane protein
MLKFAVAYLATGVAFAVIDAVWLTTAGPRLYRPALDSVLAAKFNLPAAIVFYLIYVAGIVALAVLPTVREEGTWTRALTTGAMLGFVAYATYDLTNQATLKVWATHITLIDITWGTFLTAVGATVGGLVIRRMKA